MSAHGQGPAVSRLGDLVAAMRARLDQIGDPTPVMIGNAYVDNGMRGPGFGPRIVLVPYRPGSISAPPKMAPQLYVGSVTLACDVHVRGPEGGDEAKRHDAAEALMDRAWNLIEAIGAGKITPGNVSDDSPTAVNAFGADLVFGFRYARGIARDAAVWGASVAAQPTPNPMTPNGDNGQTFELSADAETSATR